MKKILLSLFLAVTVIFTLSGCKNNDEQNSAGQETVSAAQQSDSNQNEKAPEISKNPNKQVDITQSDVVKQSKDISVKNKTLLTYSVEKPVSSNTALPSSMVRVVFSSDSANPAFKEGVSENIDKYIEMQPKIKGKWQVKNNKSLIFTPQQEWAPETTYTVTIDNTAFNDYYKVANNTFSFKTAPFTFQINSEYIHNDFDNEEREYTLHILFNYLFNQKQFKKEAKLTLAGQEIPFKVTFDKDGYGAVIKSSKFKMFTNNDIVLNFTLPKISSADGSRKLEYEIYHSYVINKILEQKSFFVEDVRSFITNDEKGNPRNVLTVTFSLPVNISDLVQHSGLFNDNDEIESFFYSDENVKRNINMTPIYNGNNADTVISFYIDVYNDKKYDEEKSFYFVIKNTLNSVSGKSLNDYYKERVTFRTLPQTVSIMQQGSLLSLKSQKMVTFESRGLNSLNVEVGRILPEQVQHIINFTNSSGLGEVSFKDRYTMDTSNFAEYKKAKLPLASNDRVMPSYATINLEEYLGAKPGLYYVKADGLDNAGNKVYKKTYYDDEYYYDEYEDEYYSGSSYVETSRFILVTDMYMITKQNKNKQVDVFVASISKGEPVKNAKVEVIAKNGLPILSGQTDGNGHFKYEVIISDTPITVEESESTTTISNYTEDSILTDEIDQTSEAADANLKLNCSWVED